MADEKVKVRIKPLMGIGGVGNAGDVVWMSRADAEMYFRDGYVEYVEEGDQPSPSPQPSPDGRGSEVEDHQIMKPETRRSGKVARKK